MSTMAQRRKRKREREATNGLVYESSLEVSEGAVAPVSIDREARLIQGVELARVGVFKSRRGQFDEAGLAKIAEWINADPKGLPSRWTHPTGESLGTWVGRFRNARVEDGILRADLKISETAMQPPPGKGGQPYGEYILSLAEEDPDAFGTSLVVVYQKALADGSRYDEKKHAGQVPLWIPRKVIASDIVAVGDATESFLSALPEDVVRLAEENPQFVEALQDFTHQYLSLVGEEQQQGEDTVSDQNNSESLSKEDLASFKTDILNSIGGVIDQKLQEERDRREADEKKAKDTKEIVALCKRGGLDAEAYLSAGDVDKCRKDVIDALEAKLESGESHTPAGSGDNEPLKGELAWKKEYEDLEMADLGVTWDEFKSERERSTKPEKAYDASNPIL